MGPFDRAFEHDQLLTEQQILGDEFWLAASKICDRTQDRRLSDGCGPAREGVPDGLQAMMDGRLNTMQDGAQHHYVPLHDTRSSSGQCWLYQSTIVPALPASSDETGSHVRGLVASYRLSMALYRVV